MGLNSSNSLFNDEEDYNYEIDSTQNLQGTQSKFMNSMDNFPNVNSQKDNSTYISQLEYKIRDQAKRLSELEKYKYLCERRIKQLNPNHPLPLTEEILEIPIQKDEIIDIEEQKNYYDLLRKTIENDLLKNGVLNKYINVDGVLELAKIKNECEEYRKQLVLAQSMINSLKSDVEDLIKENNNFKNEKNVNDSKDKINNLNNEFQKQINELTKENMKLNKELNTFKDENSSLKAENFTLDIKLKDIYKNDDNKIENINKRLNDYKLNYDKVNSDFEILLKEKADLKKENLKLQNENHKYQEQLYSLEVQIDKLNSGINTQREREINDEYKNMYNELLVENQNLKKLLNNNNNNLIDSHNYDNENSNFTILSSEINKLQIEKEKMKIDLENVLYEKINLEKENDSNKNLLKNLNIEKVKMQLENEKLNKEILTLRDKYSTELTNKSTIIQNYQDELSKFKLANDENKKENYNLNDNYSQAVQKYNFLNTKFDDLSTKYETISKEYEKVKKEKELLEKKNNSNENELKILQNQCKKYIDENSMIKLSEDNLKKIVEQTENKVHETMQYNGKINVQIKEMENELEEKDKIIEELEKNKKDFEKIVSEKLGNFDEYISCNKSSIYDLMKKLSDLSNNFDKLANKDLNNNIFTKEFSNGITKVVSQINSINNIKNYDIQLNDQIFFDTLDLFLTIISKEIINIYERNLGMNFETLNKLETINDDEIKNKNNFNIQLMSLTKERDNLFNDYSHIKERNLKIEKDFHKIKLENRDLKVKYDDVFFRLSQNEKTLEMNNKNRKNLFMVIQKFIRLFPYKDFTKIMLDIINLIDQIGNDELNKCLIEDKLAIMEYNFNNYSKKNPINNDLNTILQKEYDDLKNLLNDLKNKIIIKNEKLKALNEEYEQYKKIFNDKVSNDYNKTLKLNCENMELKNRIKDLESAIEILNRNKNQVITIETKLGNNNKIEPNDILVNTNNSRQNKINIKKDENNKSVNLNKNINDDNSISKKLELYSFDDNLLNHNRLNNENEKDRSNEIVLTNYDEFVSNLNE